MHADTKIGFPQVISEVSRLINKHHFSPKDVPTIVRKLKSLERTEFLSVREFQLALNKILQAEDAHFGILLNEQRYWNQISDIPIKRDKSRHLMKAGILEQNIGYLKLDKFLDSEESTNSYKNAINEVKNSNALILDLRNNAGGSPRAAIRLVEMLVDLGKKNLFQITNRNYPYFMESSGDQPIFANSKAPIFILTSNETASAAEAVTFLLEFERGAVIIGERTVGAGNLATKYSVDDDFTLLVPTSLVRHYETGKSWENNGIVPDVQVSSEEALDRAVLEITTAGS